MCEIYDTLNYNENQRLLDLCVQQEDTDVVKEEHLQQETKTGLETSEDYYNPTKPKTQNICWFLFGAVRPEQQSRFLPQEAEQQEHFHEGKVDEGVLSSSQEGCAGFTSHKGDFLIFLSA